MSATIDGYSAAESSTMLYDIARTPRQIALMAREEQNRNQKEKIKRASIVERVL